MTKQTILELKGFAPIGIMAPVKYKKKFHGVKMME
jgi:hypothetical protein